MSSLDAALLTALRTSTVHLPGAELAASLHTDPATVAARVEELRVAGFEIENRPGLGYRLGATPDRLVADDLQSRLGPSAFIRDILVFEETDSTNQRAIDLGMAGALGGVAIFAEKQTLGRGRFGRRWESSSHLGLWFSLLLRPRLPMAQWARLTTWAAVAAAEAIAAEVPVRVQIKWPNDLECAGRKLAGILIETMPDHHGSHFAVVGIGINVNHEESDFPEELSSRATSIRLSARRTVDRPALAARLLATLADRFSSLADARFPELLQAAGDRSSLLGRRVALATGENRIEGIAEGLAPDGRLLLRRDDGELTPIGAGEATVLR